VLSKRGTQGRLFEAGWRYGDFVGQDTFYGFMAQQRDIVFADDKFADLYCLTNGRPSVLPSVLATALVLQTHDRVADEEARQRATYDLRWKVALGVEWDVQPFAKSTLQEFRAQLVVHDKQLVIFEESLQLAKEQGFIKQHKKLKLALDTSNILGAAAVKDTFNLLGDGIVQLGRALAKQCGMTVEAWAEEAGCTCYVSASSLKGQADIAWDRPAERKRFLGQIVADADRVLEQARVTRERLEAGSPEDQAVAHAAGLLSRMLLQNIERKATVRRDTPALTEQTPASKPGGPPESRPTSVPEPTAAVEGAPTAQTAAEPEASAASAEPSAADPLEARLEDVDIKQGVAPDRVLSVHDPDMRHGHKSASKRFNGFKAQVAVDTDSQLITAVAVLPGNAPDHDQALAMVEQTETATGCSVAETIGDCAYGDGPTRQAFADAGRTLIAKVPTATNQGRFPKTDFVIDLDAGSCTCPAGQTTTDLRPSGEGQQFHFATAVCASCPVREQCLRGDTGRTVQVHPQEALLQAARAFQASPAFTEYRSRRQAAEHAFARLMQRGLRKARYRGTAKVLFQLAMAAAVLNLKLLANSLQPTGANPTLAAACSALTATLLAIWVLSEAISAPNNPLRLGSVRPPVPCPNHLLPLQIAAFWPDF